MKARAASPDMLVDLNGLAELRGIELAGDGTLTIGAMTTYTELMRSAEAKARPILGEVCATIADVQVRNRGTIGGNVCSNDPTNHLPPLMVAVGATMTVVGAGGEREVPAEEFFLGVYMTAVGPGELLTKISIPGRQEGRLRRGHARRGGDVHRERGGDRERLGARRARLRRRGAGRRHGRLARRCRRRGARRGDRPAVRRPRLGRVPAASHRGRRDPRRKGGCRADERRASLSTARPTRATSSRASSSSTSCATTLT